MLRLFSVFTISYFLLLPSYSLASVGQIQNLLNAGKFKEAYALANIYVEEFEGDPAFDFSYGVAAIDSGNPSEGVFALERVMLLTPDNHLAKLELARGYYFLRQYDKSRQLFNAVLAVNPPALVQERISDFLEQINEKTTVVSTRFTGFVELLSGYDSNVNSGPDTGSDVVILSNDALEHSDQYRQLQLAGSIEHDYSDAGSLVFRGSMGLRYYDTEPEQDYKNFSLSGAHRWNTKNQQFQLGFSTQKYSLGGDDYRDLLGMDLGWNYQLDSRSILRTSLGINKLTYSDFTYKDSVQTTLNSNFLYAGQGSWNPIWFAGVFVGDETPDENGILANADVDRKFYGVSGGVQLSPHENITLTPSFVYQSSQYKGLDWIYGVRRKDDYFASNFTMEWAVRKSWVLLANYSYAVADSNIELYEYDRQQVMLGLRYNFN